ncbi:MAG: NUDIX domain-containing protein [Gammaproteobacteria bacterium]|nr:histidine phosphatase family protein [Gammaproteobacteria bacterium]NNJ90885.1 NUDIX domain-containing protein [Gammaproteobacteria bacterium]
MTELLVYRHGHAKRNDVAADIDRELRDKGKRNAQRIGIWLARHNKLPDLVIASPATRARRTAEKTCKTAGLSGDKVKTDERIYQSGVNELLEVLRELDGKYKRVLLVGHNPSLEMLLDYLCWNKVPRRDKGGVLSPASLACLKLDVSWRKLEKATAELEQIIYPQSLPRLFPFPELHDAETRSRPAYYYQQSSVIPYRDINGKLEIMVIMSSKNKHWVIPKGIHDPGLTAQESAEKEAFEEAGVEGKASKKELGRYRYPKWDAECEVKVFPMQVSKVIPEVQWQERHRMRQWLSVEKAAALIKNPDVQRLVKALPQWLEKHQ